MIDRKNAYIWNFLPPDELNSLLSLYKTVTKKTLRISLVFGIEGKQLLSEEDNYQALKDFNAEYEGTESASEEMALEYQSLMEKYPDYQNNAEKLPRRIFSGKNPEGTKGIFFCFKLPTKNDNNEWTSDDGICKWIFLNTETKEIEEDPFKMWKIIQCSEEEPRMLHITVEQFTEYKNTVKRHLDRYYMRQMQVPIADKNGKSLKMQLVTWMQIQ